MPIDCQLHYYTRDHLASVREMVNGSGAIVSRLHYDTYGKMDIVSGTNLPTNQFTNDYYHTTSGLYLTKYRAYDSSAGRWLSRDPIQEKGGINLYEYVDNDSANAIDQEGLESGFYDPNDLERTTNGITCTRWMVKKKVLQKYSETSRSPIATTGWQDTTPVVLWYRTEIVFIPMQIELIKYRVTGFKDYFELLVRYCCNGESMTPYYNTTNVTEPFDDIEIEKYLRVKPELEIDPEHGDIEDPEPEHSPKPGNPYPMQGD